MLFPRQNRTSIADLDDVLGDLVRQYDPARRRGFNFNLKHHAGMTSSQSNYRNVHFGIDNGQIDPAWTDCGRPGNNIFVCAMAVHEGSLYVGTCEPGEEESGRVYRYAGGQEWIDCGRLDEADDVFALAVYRGDLYAIPMYTPGVFRWAGETIWEYCGTPADLRSMTLAVFNGDLYSTGNGSAGVWRHRGGTDWEDCGQQAEETQTYSVAIYEGNMYVGTWPSGPVFRYQGGTAWAHCGRLGEEKEVIRRFDKLEGLW